MKAKYFFQSVIISALLTVGFIAPQTVSAVDICAGDGANSTYCQNRSEGETKVNSVIQSAINVLLTAVGVISIIMIVVGGIMFALSSGDAGKVSKARNMVIYAVVGLVVALFAAAIVNFVFNRVK